MSEIWYAVKKYEESISIEKLKPIKSDKEYLWFEEFKLANSCTGTRKILINGDGKHYRNFDDAKYELIKVMGAAIDDHYDKIKSLQQSIIMVGGMTEDDL